jgi:predicted nucleic acid-binding Zn ribbon protein
LAFGRFCHSCGYWDRIELNPGSSDLKEGSVVDPEVVKEHHKAAQKRQRMERLFMRLVFAIVGMTVVYQLFKIVLNSS